MNIFWKTKTPDVNPVKLFADELTRVVTAAKARHVHASVIARELELHAEVIRSNAAVNYSPTRIYSGNLPEWLSHFWSVFSVALAWSLSRCVARSWASRRKSLSPQLALAATQALTLTAHINCAEYSQSSSHVMAEAVSEAEQARRDREWADYQRRAKQRLAQSWKLFDGKPSDILTDPELQNPEPPTQRKRERYQPIVDTNKWQMQN
jgi:hypothetical protein